MQQRLGKKLVFFPLPLQGHQTPMLQLAQILHSKGFSISIIHTQLNSPKSTKYPHFSFYQLQSSYFGLEATSSDHVLAFLDKLNVDLLVPFKDVLSQILSENVATDEPVCCLITDALWYFTQDVADCFNLARIVLRTSSSCSFLSFTRLSLLKDKGYLSAQGNHLEETVQELPPLKVKDITILCTSDRESTYELVLKLMDKARASKVIIFNSFEELEGPSLAMIREDITNPVFALGPFHKLVQTYSDHLSLAQDDQSCISWLDAHPLNSVLYVSFGSIITMDKEEFLEIAWGLANSKQPFLWVIRPGLIRDSNELALLPNGFLDVVVDRGLVIRWAPQKEVLAHRAIGGFWTHSGWNSTLESICEGVPMLCLPAFGDQRTNARYVTNVWKVGLMFENRRLNRHDIEKEIRRLMVEEEGREIRKRIICLKEKVNLCISKGGSSSMSLDNLVAHILSF